MWTEKGLTEAPRPAMIPVRQMGGPERCREKCAFRCKAGRLILLTCFFVCPCRNFGLEVSKRLRWEDRRQLDGCGSGSVSASLLDLPPTMDVWRLCPRHFPVIRQPRQA